MRISRTLRRGAGVTGALVLLAGGVAVTQATGDSPTPPTRAEALLAAVQAEQAGTARAVSTISLEHVVDGREIYALSGPATSCILVAGEAQALGRSESLVCTNPEVADVQRPMKTGFATASGVGYVDLVWVGENAPAQVNAKGAPVGVQLGSEIISARRNDDTAASGLEWQGPSAEPVEVELQSRADRIADAVGGE